MTTVIYPLGTGSNWQNNELRYSIKLMQKFHTGEPLQFVVCGESFHMEGVLNIKYNQRPRSRFCDSSAKILTAIEHTNPDRVILMNDDFFMTRHYDVTTLPLIYDGTIDDRMRRKGISMAYKLLLHNSGKKEDKNFAVHFPMVVNWVNDFEIILTQLLMDDVDFSPRIMYGNQTQEPNLFHKDIKYLKPTPLEQIMEDTEVVPFFSIDDGFITEDTHKLFETLLK